MWLSDRRKFLTGAVALGAGVMAGCGFTPAYGPDGGAGKLQNAILVDAPSTTDSYFLVRQLETRLGRASTPRYGLSLALDTREEGIAVDAANNTNRFNVVGKTTFALRDLNTGQVLITGSVNSFTGYSASGSTAATQAAKRDAYERLMTILADQMTTRLIAAAPGLPA